MKDFNLDEEYMRAINKLASQKFTERELYRAIAEACCEAAVALLRAEDDIDSRQDRELNRILEMKVNNAVNRLGMLLDVYHMPEDEDEVLYTLQSKLHFAFKEMR